MVSDDGDVGPVLDSAPCGFVAFADDGTIRAANATLCAMLRVSRAEIVGRHVESILAIGSRIFYQTHFFPLLRLHGHAEEIFLLLRASDGAEVAALANAVRHERGGDSVTDCVLMEVRERRKFEDALLAAKKRAEAASALADEHRRELERANAALEQQAVELELSQQQLQEQAAELEAQGEELRVINDDLLERTEELEAARRAADEANHAKSDFLATMSHELRTPLNAIGGYVQLLAMGLHGPITEAQREALDRIDRSERHLLRLVNDVLNLARIESGRVEYRVERVSLAEVVAVVMPMVEPQLSAAGIRAAVDVAESAVARADREKVEQVLLNLLSNASKFTPDGGEVSVDAVELPHLDGRRIALRVRDTGVGIPADRLTQVFEPFVQVDASRARQKQGTGLGLAISRDLARGMGGDLTVESVLGAGSTFTLTLPSE